jgi:succinate dehydrogenase/fumarate reductase-like Fe-S protein
VYIAGAVGAPGKVARRQTLSNCTMACPRDIQITKAIGELKMAMRTGKVE